MPLSKSLFSQLELFSTMPTLVWSLEISRKATYRSSSGLCKMSFQQHENEQQLNIYASYCVLSKDEHQLDHKLLVRVQDTWKNASCTHWLVFIKFLLSFNNFINTFNAAGDMHDCCLQISRTQHCDIFLFLWQCSLCLQYIVQVLLVLFFVSSPVRSPELVHS